MVKIPTRLPSRDPVTETDTHTEILIYYCAKQAVASPRTFQSFGSLTRACNSQKQMLSPQ